MHWKCLINSKVHYKCPESRPSKLAAYATDLCILESLRIGGCEHACHVLLSLSKDIDFWLAQRSKFRAILVLLLLFTSPCLIKAQTVPEPTSIPELTSISPQGGQRGTNVEITLNGKNISKATALLFSGEGISGKIGEKTGEAAVFFSGQGCIRSHPPTIAVWLPK